jgi:hypothetical protein
MTPSNRPFPDLVVLKRREVAGDFAWLDTRKAAVYTRVSVSTIRKACSGHELRHIRIDRTNGPIRTRTEWIDAWLMQFVQGPALG